MEETLMEETPKTKMEEMEEMKERLKVETLKMKMEETLKMKMEETLKMKMEETLKIAETLKKKKEETLKEETLKMKMEQTLKIAETLKKKREETVMGCCKLCNELICYRRNLLDEHVKEEEEDVTFRKNELDSKLKKLFPKSLKLEHKIKNLDDQIEELEACTNQFQNSKKALEETTSKRTRSSLIEAVSSIAQETVEDLAAEKDRLTAKKKKLEDVYKEMEVDSEQKVIVIEALQSYWELNDARKKGKLDPAYRNRLVKQFEKLRTEAKFDFAQK